MSATHHRKIETRRKKTKRAIPRPALSRNQGNTAAGRKALKKRANLARGRSQAQG